MRTIEDVADALRGAASVVTLTGAGISAPSGIPTFRGEDGVWNRFDQGDLHYDRLQRDPGGFWQDRLALRNEMFGDEYEPNIAHEALARLGTDGIVDAIITQNTDGLHERAGDAIGDTDTELLELHGNAHRVVCQQCGDRYAADPVFDRVREGECPPRCDCGGVLKPAVVLFGEGLPAETLERAQTLACSCDVFLAIGSSLVVEPAATLPRRAVRNGAQLVTITLEETPHDPIADHVLRENVTTVLPRLREAAVR